MIINSLKRKPSKEKLMQSYPHYYCIFPKTILTLYDTLLGDFKVNIENKTDNNKWVSVR